jgi:hypothetical protein
MTTVFQMNATEMDNRFVDAVKSLFKDSTITISIEKSNDLTDSFNDDVLTRQQLTKAMNGSRQGTVIGVDVDDLFNKIENGMNFETFMSNRG